jgi:hypothetical protein
MIAYPKGTTMLTMNSGTQSQIDDLLDARATIRQLRLELAKRRLAYLECKERLATASERLEDVLTEFEQKQGRLPFGDDAAEAGPAEGANTYTGKASGRKVKRRAVSGESNWSDTR